MAGQYPRTRSLSIAPRRISERCNVRVGLLTREYPPEVYGGAGVHVEYLARELSQLADVTVHAFGAPRDPATSPRVVSHPSWDQLDGDELALAALRTISTDLSMVAGAAGLDVVHTHTWYANLAGHLSKLMYDIPHVVTTHSLEPLRPWKAEQLGGGYAISSFCERTAIESADAVIAVSAGMRDDVLACYPDVPADRVTVIHNGIDTDEYQPDPATDALERLGIALDRPYVLFIGRITRQKGLTHLLAAAAEFEPDAQLVLCAGSPDTPQIRDQVEAQIAALQARRSGVVWVREMLPRSEIVQLLSHAKVFVCPSVYEPLGIVNLEAMACETAVVATATGGIPEVVVEGETGLLVPIERESAATAEPVDPAAFQGAIAERVNALLRDESRARAYGVAGRRRAVESFSWASIARQTQDLYGGLLRS
jgi:alpha-maltose-1-phosphate synthase